MGVRIDEAVQISLLTETEAREFVAKLNAEDEDGWTYSANLVDHGYYVIEVTDETGTVIGIL